MTDREIQGIIGAIENQRNAALADVARLVGKLAVAEDRIRELEEELKPHPKEENTVD